MTTQPNITRLPTLHVLIERLRQAKADETAARELRLEAEEAVLAHPAVRNALKDEGTVTVEGVKITTGYTRAWDAALLDELEQSIEPAYFPFRRELVEDRKASRVVEERFPDLWERIRAALTLKPKKPSVTLVDTKE